MQLYQIIVYRYNKHDKPTARTKERNLATSNAMSRKREIRTETESHHAKDNAYIGKGVDKFKSSRLVIMHRNHSKRSELRQREE
jgi:hypothetical protein